HVHVRELAATQLIDFAAAVFFPGAVAQGKFARYGNYRDFARIFAVGIWADLDADLLPSGVFKVTVDLLWRANIASTHRQQIIAGAEVNARLRERSARLRVPTFAVVDTGKAVAAVFDLVIRAEQPALHLFGWRSIAAADKHVAHGFFAQ